MRPAYFFHFHSLMVLLLTICCWRHASSESKLSLIHARLINLLKTKQKYFYRRSIRNNMDRNTNTLDLRNHRLFHSDALDCCPTLTEQIAKSKGISQDGVVLELFSTPQFQQKFYETLCHPRIKNRPCQYIDPKFYYRSRCVQQYSYVYVVGRTYGSQEQFRLDLSRIASGCKCQLLRDNYLGRRKKRESE